MKLEGLEILVAILGITGMLGGLIWAYDEKLFKKIRNVTLIFLGLALIRVFATVVGIVEPLSDEAAALEHFANKARLTEIGESEGTTTEDLEQSRVISNMRVDSSHLENSSETVSDILDDDDEVDSDDPPIVEGSFEDEAEAEEGEFRIREYIEQGDSSIFDIELPPSLDIPDNRVGVAATTNLESSISSENWTVVASESIRAGDTNCIVEVQHSSLPASWNKNTVFYKSFLYNDSDGDGLSDIEELLIYRTDPLNPDTDGDGILDGDEIRYNFNPNSTDADRDTDGDGILDVEECVYGTSSRTRDTDGDGLDDLSELGRVRLLNDFIWYDTDSSESILENRNWLPIDDNVWTKNLYCPTMINGTSYDRISIDSNALVYLIPSNGIAVDSSNYAHGGLPAISLANTNLVIAVNWQDMLLRANSSVDIRVKNIISNGVTVVEYRNLSRTEGLESMTSQVIIPSGTNETIYVSYYAVDDVLDGRNSTIGLMNSSARTYNNIGKYYSLQWSYNKIGSLRSGSTIEYRVGTGTDPLERDTDGDGLSDYDEVYNIQSDPCLYDTDEDGLSDGEECELHTSSLLADTDGDGLLDGWEMLYGFNPCVAEVQDLDRDYDGLTDSEESAFGSDPYSFDTDGDGLSDGVEALIGTKLDNSDSDNDGLSDKLEYDIGTDPNRKDTDGDGIVDKWEYEKGFDPTCPDDGPMNIANYLNHTINLPVEHTKYLAFDIYSDYATWVLEIVGLNEKDSDTHRISMGYPGSQQNETISLAKGGKYSLKMQWLNCNGHEHDDVAPWYCWQLRVNECPSVTTYDWHSTTRNTGVADYIIGDGWSIDNRSGLVTSHVHKDSSPLSGGNTAEGLESTLYVWDIKPMICEPGDPNWEELNDSHVVLDNEMLCVRIQIYPAIDSFESFKRLLGDKFVISTSGSCPDGVSIPILEQDFMTTADSCEIRKTFNWNQLVRLGLLPRHSQDGVGEMSAYDVGTIEGVNGSDLTDSMEFINIGLASRGWATAELSRDLESDPPNSIPSESFFKSAGVEIVMISFMGVTSSKKQIMNQADYFYYSGHGLHKFAMVDEYEPSVVEGWWNRDLNCVVFNGCSVLDINDYNDRFSLDPDDHIASPGKLWNNVGPSIMLGYNAAAPSDESGYPARIISSWTSGRQSLGDVEAWMRANDSMYGRNACAIIKNQRYCYFKKIVSGIYLRKEVQYKDW